MDEKESGPGRLKDGVRETRKIYAGVQQDVVCRGRQWAIHSDIHWPRDIIYRGEKSGVLLCLEGESLVLLVIGIKGRFVGIVDLQEAEQGQMRVLVFMFDVMLDKQRQFEGLVSLRRTEEVDGHQQYGDRLFHAHKGRIFF